MRIDLRPDGETSRKSRSAGKAWLNPLSVTETRCTTPTSPTTVMVDGKSEAAWPLAGQGLGQSVIVIAVEFVNDVAASTRVNPMTPFVSIAGAHINAATSTMVD